jgi:hypothetical protein
VLVWFLLTNVSGGLASIQTKMNSAEVSMGAFAAEQREFNDRRQTQLDIQLRIMRVMCVNGAKSESSVKACME